MTEIFGKLKVGADKARFEAERLIRLNQAQSVVKDLERQLQVATAAMGSQALALYDSGKLTQPELVATCQQIQAVRQRISAQMTEIERIRQEQPPEAPVTAHYGHICPVCQVQLPAGTAFCPRCGSQAVDIAPPAVQAGVRCRHCGAVIPPGARFCPVDGSPVEVPAETRTASPQNVCPSCHASIPAEAVFCPHCGASTTAPTGPELAEAERMAGAEALGGAHCPNCGSPIPREAAFCPECGHRVTAGLFPPEAPAKADDAVVGTKCPNCGLSIPAEAVFCPECGSPVTPASSDLFVVEAPPEIPEDAAIGICPSCQGTIPAGAEFCPLCGEPVRDVSQDVVEDEIAPVDELHGEETVPEEVEEPFVPELAETEAQLETEEPVADRLCPGCGASVPPEAEFCPECGESVVAE
jgi:predicted amidophosphoribosyltransferase